MLKRISLLVALTIMGLSISTEAARVTVDARLDSVAMMIGNQNRLYLEIFAPIESRVEVPVCLADTLVQGVRILKRTDIDSTDIDNSRKKLSMNYLLTSFDEGLYYLPPVTIKVDGEEYESNYLSLKVMTYEVDTASMQIFDIKPVEKAPFKIMDYLSPVLYSLGGVALIVVAILLYLKYRKKGEKEPEIEPEMLLPPHVAALQALEVIKTEKIWTQGLYKEFYTQLTDVMRKYISRRFGVGAMEMTSSEILDALRRDPEAKSVYANLKQILELSDFVKFAKMNPLPDDNNRSISDAYLFVNETKIEEKPETDATQQTDLEGKEDKAL